MYILYSIVLMLFVSLSPAASSISSESSPVSSPATNHSSPVSTPKRGPLGPGPVLVPPTGHSVPNTPPVVTIAPTKTSNGLWRSEGRQVRHTPTDILFLKFPFILSEVSVYFLFLNVFYLVVQHFRPHLLA